MFGRKPSGGLLLAGLAAFALYKYSKMSAEQKSNLTKNIKEQGNRILGQVAPGLKSKIMNDDTGNMYSGAGM